MKLQLEQQLLLSCARTVVTAEGAAQIRSLLTQDIDWSRLFSLAERHRVIPLLSRTLSQVCPEAVPSPIIAQLRNITQAIALHTMPLTDELLRLLSLFAEQGVVALPYKGPLLALQVYGNLALRPFGDLDVLIYRNDLLRARQILLQQGYQPLPEPPGYRFSMAHTHEYHEYKLTSPDGRVCVELQWAVMEQPFSFPPQAEIERWQRQTQTVQIAGQPVRCLPPELLLLLLCSHGTKHVWERLVWICDIAELLRANPALDWDIVLSSARRLRVERMVLLSLLLASQLLDAPLPASLRLRAQADKGLVSQSALIHELLSRDEDLTQELTERRNLFLLQAMDHWSDRVGLCLRYSSRLLNPSRMYRRYGLDPLRTLLGW